MIRWFCLWRDYIGVVPIRPFSGLLQLTQADEAANQAITARRYEVGRHSRGIGLKKMPKNLDGIVVMALHERTLAQGMNDVKIRMMN
jgi:hypothetical protein